MKKFFRFLIMFMGIIIVSGGGFLIEEKNAHAAALVAENRQITGGYNFGVMQIIKSGINNHDEKRERLENKEVRDEVKSDLYYRNIGKEAYDKDLYFTAMENYIKAFVLGNSNFEDMFYLEATFAKLRKSDLFDLEMKLFQEAQDGRFESKMVSVYFSINPVNPDLHNLNEFAVNWLKEGFLAGNPMMIYFVARIAENEGEDKWQDLLQVAAEKNNQLANNYLNSTKAKLKISNLRAWNANDNKPLSPPQVIFSKDEVRYITIGMNLKFDDVLQPNAPPRELFLKYFDPSGELLHGEESPAGYTCKVGLDSKTDTKSISIGWGNKEKSTYKHGMYSIEIWFQGLMLDKLFFQVI